MGRYRYSLDLGDKYLFGSELEFTGVYISELSRVFREKSLPVRFALNHKSRGFTKFDEWYLDIDNTVTKNENHEYLGGELSSKILTDKKEIWIELKAICDVLKEMGAYANAHCSNHVRVNLSNISDERYFFEVLSKLITLYETEIKLFYMGDKYLIREELYDNARDLGFHLLAYINNVDFSDPNYFYNFRNNRFTIFTRKDGVNLQAYQNKKLMEIRYPNGSVNEKTIQNNINFSLKLVDAIERKVFDPEELTRKIEENRSQLFIKHTFAENCNSDFEYLAKTISTSESDTFDFMSQYEKVLANKPR